jgi:cytoplasmic FMR1 interacting protein
VRYNYSTKERLALVTSISLIKSLEKQLLSISNDVLQALYRYVYSSTQRFVKGTVREMMVYAEKKKKPAVMAIVQHVYAILSDAVDSDDQSPRSPSATVSTGRAISVAITQLHYTKVLLEAATSDKAKGMSGGFLKEKDFKDSHVTEVNDYLARALHYPTMLDFMTTVAECADLSELWYKEYYLELTKQIQFPIEMSLPWILAETVIDSEEPELVE